MSAVLDAFWRALAYCLHPRVMLLSFLPLLLVSGVLGLWAYFYWELAIDQVRYWLEQSLLLSSAWRWLEGMGWVGLKSVLAHMLVILAVTPVVVVLCVLLVALFMAPGLARMVARRRFADLQVLGRGAWWRSALWSLGVALAALLACVLTLPLWLLPPVAVVLPPLIWGWLTYKVMAFDALADFASAQERRQLMRQHAMPLMVMGVLCGYLGAAPSVIWSLGLMVIVWAPVLLPLSVWLYMLVFAFSALWFAHYCLAALQALRVRAQPGDPIDPGEGNPPVAAMGRLGQEEG
ncbi:MAG: EI24 domain-containing protein [Rhodoferax sp.]